MTAAAERAIDRHVAGAGPQALQDLVHHDRPMRAGGRLAGGEDLLHVGRIPRRVQLLVSSRGTRAGSCPRIAAVADAPAVRQLASSTLRTLSRLTPASRRRPFSNQPPARGQVCLPRYQSAGAFVNPPPVRFRIRKSTAAVYRCARPASADRPWTSTRRALSTAASLRRRLTESHNPQAPSPAPPARSLRR